VSRDYKAIGPSSCPAVKFYSFKRTEPPSIVNRFLLKGVILEEDLEEDMRPVSSMRPSPMRLCTILLETENTAKPMYEAASMCIKMPLIIHQMSEAAVEPCPRPTFFVLVDDW
jgi:hypothetical protein